MTGPDASSGEMPRVPMPGLAGRDHDDLLLDMILDRRPLPPDAPPGMHVLASKLVGLAAAPGGVQLPGEAAALAAFAGSGSPASTLTLAGEPPGRHRSRRLMAGRARLTAAAAAVAVVLSGTAAAAYAGVLPASVQDFAHHVIDAPAAQHAVQHGGPQHRPGQPGDPGTTPSSPSARGSAHPAKPGQQKNHKGRGHRAGQGQRSHPPKPTHPVNTPHSTHTPRSAKASASPSPSPSAL
jgi:hypothetical protein